MQIENKHGQLDVLVNNAGILQIGTIGNTTFDQWRKVQSVNSDGVFLGVKHAVELMRKHKTRGSIINLCSILGQVGTRDCVAYPASKGLVKLLTKSVALDEAPHGIRVNNVCPAYIETPLLDVMSKEEHDALLAMHPMGRLGRPEEVAQAILFLASNESSYVTGSELMVDGGYTAGTFSRLGPPPPARVAADTDAACLVHSVSKLTTSEGKAARLSAASLGLLWPGCRPHSGCDRNVDLVAREPQLSSYHHYHRFVCWTIF